MKNEPKMPDHPPDMLIYSRLRSCRHFYVMNCSVRGYHVLEAATLEECEQFMQKYQPRFMLVCGLPTVESEIAKMRESEILKDIPMISVSIFERDAEWREQRGVVAHFVHPPSIPDLLQLLNRLI